MFATGVPDRQDLELVTVDSVVQEILGAIQEEPAYLQWTTGVDLCADGGLRREDFECVLDVLPNSSG